jgi:hypothetical protein
MLSIENRTINFSDLSDSFSLILVHSQDLNHSDYRNASKMWDTFLKETNNSQSLSRCIECIPTQIVQSNNQISVILSMIPNLNS